MTKQDFIDRFFIEYDKIASLGSPGYDLNELSKLVTEAQESLIIKKYGPNSNRLKEGFEETEKRIEELGELVVYKDITNFTPGFLQNSVNAKLPNSLLDLTNASTTKPAGPLNFDDVYWYTIYEEAITDQLDCTIANNTTVYITVNVLAISHDTFNQSYLNPFRKPYINADRGQIFRLRGSGRNHLLVTDGTFNITTYKIGYIRKPKPIDISLSTNNQVCELNDSFHRELLKETIDLAKLIVQDPTYQISKQEITE